MNNYKLLALDLDGTLLNGQGEISAENKLWVRRAAEAGVTVCASTGRGFPTALPIVEELGLDTPMITVNGGEIWLKPHQLHRRRTMTSDQIVQLHRLTERYPDLWYWGYSTERIYNKERWTEDPLAHEWLKFGYHTEDPSIIEQLLAEIHTWDNLEITNSALTNIEINAAGVTKAAALEEVCQLLGFEMSEVVAVGDSLNDIAAIRAAGLGVAMGNAQDAVKEAADVVTGHHDHDGVAELIQNYVLKA